MMVDFDKSDPPDHLRRRVDNSLQNRGLISPPSWTRSLQIALATAAALALLAGGFAIGRREQPNGPRIRSPRFMLLLFEDSTFLPAVTGSHNMEYAAWADSLGQAGKLEAGEELDAADVRLGAIGARGPQPSGFFVIRAADAAEAEAIARTCPHVRYRGTVSIRPIKT